MKQIILDRRALHRIPELQLYLPQTMEYLYQALAGLKCRVFAPMESALCAYFDFGADSAIAFRADCDGLPIEENTNLDFASCHPGRMHACGHDGHMAILLELARRLNKKKSLSKNVLLIFQPGEESPGGARYLCETGMFSNFNVEAVFGLHLWPGLEKGTVFTRENELMSRSCEINVDIYGKSAHIAKAKDGIDALAACMEFYRRATALEQALPPEISRLLKFGHMEAGTVRNAIAAEAHLEGSLRAFQDPVFEGLRECLYKIAKDIGREFGCTVELSMSEGYPAVMNDPDLCRRVKGMVDFQDLEEPSMTSEDFSFYQKQVPGIFFFLGLGDTPALHSRDFHFEEELLVTGADFFDKLAENYK